MIPDTEDLDLTDAAERLLWAHEIRDVADVALSALFDIEIRAAWNAATE